MELQQIQQFGQDEAGQDTVEYALLLGFVVAASAAGITWVLDALSALWTALNNLMSSPG